MPTPPAAPRVRFLLSALAPPASRAARWGRIAALSIATLGPPAAAIRLLTMDHGPPPPMLIPGLLLILSALLTHHGRAASQILARSVWWTNLLLGVLLSITGSGSERSMGLLLVVTTGAPLLAMGRLGLDEDEGSAFRPVAFRSTLSLAMIMAVADAQALVFWGALKLGGKVWRQGPLSTDTEGAILIAAAASIGVAIVGLYRLQVWGLFLSALCAIGLVALAATDICSLAFPLGHFLIATSLVQLLLPLPIVVAIARGRAPRQGAPSRLALVAPGVIVALLMAVSAYAVLIRDGRLFHA